MVTVTGSIGRRRNHSGIGGDCDARRSSIKKSDG
jgi:hypothetical protein